MKKLKAVGAALALSVVSLTAILLPRVTNAAGPYTCTWTGAGSDTNFSTAANWSGCNGSSPQPSDNDSLVFDNSTVSGTQNLNNDISNLSVGNIDFTGSNNTSNYDISGNAITVTNGVTDNTVSSISPELTAVLVISGNQTVSTTDAAGLILSSLQGSGNITVTGGQWAVFEDLSNYTGTISSTTSIIDLAPAGTSTMTSTGSVVVSGEGTVNLLNAAGGKSPSLDETFDLPISLGSSDNKEIALNLSTGMDGAVDILAGTVTLTSNVTVTADGDYDLNITGPINFNGYSIASENPGVVSVNVASGSNYSSESPVIGNNVIYVDDGVVGSTTVNSGGLLKGNGTVGSTTVNAGGQVAPGHSPGCLTVNGNLTTAGTDTVDIQTPGNTACTDFSQLVVTGNVNLTGSTLSTVFLNSFTPTVGQSFEIINNEGTNAVTGTFNGLPEGTVFAVGSTHLKITYKGGSGNDVVLTVVNLPTTPNTGFGLSSFNPLLPLAGFTFAAAAVYFLARRSNKTTARK